MNEVLNVFLHNLKKYFLFSLCLITFCVSPAVAAQSKMPAGSSRFSVERYVSIENQGWWDSSKGIFKGYRMDFEDSIGVPRDEHAALDHIKTYIAGKRSLVSETDTIRTSWIITPLFDGYMNSSLGSHILPIGVIWKIRVQ